MPAPSVIEQQLIFSVDDADRAIVRLGLDCDDAVIGPRRFRRRRGGWTLPIPRPDLDRVEYRLVVTDRSGDTAVVCDPGNPERVRTAFGERSVALMPGYERPEWLQHPGPEGTPLTLTHTDEELGEIPVTVWTPAGLSVDQPAPILLANDGPEYADLADLTTYASGVVAVGAVPAFRLVLLQPVERDEWYAANPDYLAATADVVATVAAAVPVSGGPVVMGASLGGLSAVLAATMPDSPFVGAFSQSGSFFQPRLDPQESGYPYFDRVSAAVDRMTRAGPTPSPRLIGMTCGALEENQVNNAALATALEQQGHLVMFRTHADLHNYTGWRDSLHPTLTELLARSWSSDGVAPATVAGG